MTLKSHASELSQKAKAFSVENLLSAKKGEEEEEEEEEEGLEKKLGKIINSKLEIENGPTAELCGDELWQKFSRLGTEMIVTRAGRRMFPTLKVRLRGLKFSATYVVYMDVTLVGETKYRYNFQRSEWTSAGPSNSCMSNNVYIHPVSPATGEEWMSEEVSFDKIKLTNNRKPLMKDQVSLHSMHKYRPRIHVLEVPDGVKGLNSDNLQKYIWEHGGKSDTFFFEQTTFITVTAYQNQEITHLKIQSNPFAKGFRDALNTKKEKEVLSDNGYLGLVCPESCIHRPSGF